MNLDALGTSIVSILMAIIGVAILALILSPQAQTTQVLSAGGNAFAGVLQSALSPVTGGGIGGTVGGIVNRIL